MRYSKLPIATRTNSCPIRVVTGLSSGQLAPRVPFCCQFAHDGSGWWRGADRLLRNNPVERNSKNGGIDSVPCAHTCCSNFEGDPRPPARDDSASSMRVGTGGASPAVCARTRLGGVAPMARSIPDSFRPGIPEPSGIRWVVLCDLCVLCGSSATFGLIPHSTFRNPHSPCRLPYRRAVGGEPRAAMSAV
jgi:hypothetical protein